MAERSITPRTVRAALAAGVAVHADMEDRPHPTYVVLAQVARGPLHVIVADDEEADTTIVVTAYEPDREHGDPSHRRRIDR